jgi:hypothetical protein
LTFTPAKESEMFGKKKGPSQPTQPFAHAEGCPIVKADPGFEPPWQEVEDGHWRRICQCGSEDVREPRADPRTRLDPLDPGTSRHAPECEHAATTDPTIIRGILRVTESDDYWRVDCNICDCVWQVPYYAA